MRPKKDLSLCVTMGCNIAKLRKKIYPGRGGVKKSADAFGVSPVVWSRWEMGRAAPSNENQEKLARFFKVAISELLTPNDTPPNGVPMEVPAQHGGLNWDEIVQRLCEVYGVNSRNNLADILGIGPNTIGAWVLGKTRGSWPTLEKVVREKNLSWDWLLTGKAEAQGAPVIVGGDNPEIEKLKAQIEMLEERNADLIIERRELRQKLEAFSAGLTYSVGS